MAKRKKLLKKLLSGEVSVDNLTEDEQKYINKKMRKMKRDITTGKDAAVPTFKEVPCQMWPGKFAILPLDAIVVEGDDGKLYLNEVHEDNLIISQAYKDKIGTKKYHEQRRIREAEQKAVVEMKPTVLGE